MPAASRIRTVALSALAKAGVPFEQAAVQVDLLLEAELRGHASHGMLRLPRIVERIANGVANPETTGVHAWRGSSLLDVDGKDGLGPVVAQAALKSICERARQTGVAVAAIRRCNHLGMLAWYADSVARAGQILIALTTSEALVHPWGGRMAMLGTNPIAIGVPARPVPFVLDMATGLVAMGKIHDHANRDMPIPLGWALDAQGEPTTDPQAAKQGAIAPFGGAKGYGLGLAFEVLVASLTACAIGRDVVGTLDSDRICNKGDVFIAMEPAPAMLEAISGFLDQIRASPAADPERPVLVPGDRANRMREERLVQDVPLPDELWAQICALAA